MSLSITQEQNDKFYMTVKMGYNPDSQGISRAVYQEQLTQPIMNNPHDYYMTINKFTIPTQNIPIFIAEIQPPPNTDPNLTIYSVTLEYNGTVSQQYVEFVTEQPNIPVPSVSSSSGPKSPYYFVYTYNNFITMVNKALEDAYNNLPGGGPAGGEPPRFQFDPINERISLVAQYANYDENSVNKVSIYMNQALFTYFSGLSEEYLGYNQPNGMDTRIIVRWDGNNVYNPVFPGVPTNPADPIKNDYLIMTQQFPALVNWLSVKSLILVSNLLPVRLQYSVGNVQTLGNTSRSNQSIVSVQGTLSSFEPILDSGVELLGGQLQYITQGPYKLLNMFGKNAISTVDISVYWVDQYGFSYPVDIPINQVAIIEFAFFKKTTFTS